MSVQILANKNTLMESNSDRPACLKGINSSVPYSNSVMDYHALRGNSSVLYSNSVMDYHALRGNSSVPYSNSVMDYHALRGGGGGE